MKNKLYDLNDHLFAQLERLADEKLTPDQIANESKRGKVMVAVANEIIRGAALQLEAARMLSEKGAIRPLLPEMIGVGKQIDAKTITAPDRTQ